MQNKLCLADLQRMEEVLNLPLKTWRRDYHWEHEARFRDEFGLGFMCSNIDKMKNLVHLAAAGLAVLEHFKTDLDSLPDQGYTVISKVGEEYVDLQRQRAERSGRSDQGRPDEGVSETLRELPLPSVYREAISRPERTWSGFARANDLRTQDEVSRTHGGQSENAEGPPSSEEKMVEPEELEYTMVYDHKGVPLYVNAGLASDRR